MPRSHTAALAIASLAAAAAALTAAGPSRAAILTYEATLDGAGVSVPTPSLGTGEAVATIDTAADTLDLLVDYAGLSGNTTGAHIHCCTAAPDTGTAGVATPIPAFPLFPLGVTSGTYHQLFDLTAASTYNPAFVTAQGGVGGAETALLAGLAGGEAYFTLHTTAFPPGEIAGFFGPAAAPEPATWAIALLGFGLASATLRRRRAVMAA
jgi:hypothetical protein